MQISSPSSKRMPIGLAFFGLIIVGLGGGANGVLIPSLSAYYHVGEGVIGLLFLVSSLGYFLSALGSGLLTEKIGLRWLMIFGGCAFLIGELGFGLRLPFALLLVARLIVGFGIGIVETGFNVYITTLPRNAVLLNYMHACFGVGALVGPLLASSILALLWDWNIIYLLFGGLTLFLILGTVLIFHPALSSSSPDKGQAPDEAPPSVSDNVFIATLRLPIIWWGSLFLLVYVGIETCVGNWSYTFLLAERQQGTVLAGWVVSGYWLGLTIGRFVLQRQAERMGIEIGRLLSLCIFGLLGGLLLIWFIPLGAVAALGFCFIGFSLAPLYPATVVVIPRLVPARLGASAIGMLVSISILGIAILPWVAGILAQTWGIWTLLPFLIVLSIAMLALWVYLARQPGVSEKTPVIPSLPIDEVV